MFHIIYILYKILFINLNPHYFFYFNNNLPWVFFKELFPPDLRLGHLTLAFPVELNRCLVTT